jgi:hypothetical protein
MKSSLNRFHLTMESSMNRFQLTMESSMKRFQLTIEFSMKRFQITMEVVNLPVLTINYYNEVGSGSLFKKQSKVFP